MSKVKHLLAALWTSILTMWMPRATQDQTVKPENQVPPDVVKGYGYPGPEQNPYIGTDNVYLRMKWDQDHGWADYS